MGEGRRKCVQSTAEEEREAEEADKVEVAPGVAVFKLETFSNCVDMTNPRTP